MNKILGLVSCNYNNDSFGNLTAERPLAALPFGGRYRLLDFPLSNMVNVGIRTIGLITPYYYRSLLDHVGVGKEWSLNRKIGGLFILPGSIYGLKSMHGHFLLRDIIQNRAYLERSSEDHVLYCGSNKIYNMDMRPFIEAHVKAHDDFGRGITLLYKTIGDAEAHHGVYLDVDGDEVGGISRDAVGRANCLLDCFLIERRLLLNFIDWYEALNYVDIIDIIAENLANLQVGAYNFDGYVGHVDSIGDYLHCSMDLLRADVRSELFAGERKIYTKVQDYPPAKYGPAAQVANSLIPTGCIINGTVENSILFRGVEVGEGAVIRNSVVMQATDVQAGAVLENVICDKYVTINSGNKLFGSPNKPLVLAKSSEI